MIESSITATGSGSISDERVDGLDDIADAGPAAVPGAAHLRCLLQLKTVAAPCSEIPPLARYAPSDGMTS